MKTEICWLIEHISRPICWMGRGRHLVPRACDAVRFVTKEEAEKYIKDNNLPRVIATEHLFFLEEII